MILTQSDRERLSGLLRSHHAPTSSGAARVRLVEAIAAASIVDPTVIPPTVVTMNSIVTLIDITSGEIANYALVYPGDANVDRLKISVLAPLGAALLGRSEGDVIEYDTPAGTKRFFLQKVSYQPEARMRESSAGASAS